MANSSFFQNAVEKANKKPATTVERLAEAYNKNTQRESAAVETPVLDSAVKQDSKQAFSPASSLEEFMGILPTPEVKNDGLDGVALIGIRTRGVIVAERIRRYIEEAEGVSLPLGILDITLYRDDILSCDAVVKGTEIDFDITGKTIVLCDDVLYTGRTVRAAISALVSLSGKMGRAKKIQLLEVVDRGHRELPFRADFIGKNIPTALTEKVFVRFRETDGEDGVYLADGERE